MRVGLRHPSRLLVIVTGWLLTGGPALAQFGGGGPVVGNSTVGYIDSSVPVDVVRFRFDAAFNNVVPSRGEFFYARSPSLPTDKAETKVDYQEFSVYAEKTVTDRFSLFVEAPYRFINPTVDQNANGLGDMNAGFKWAFYRDDDHLLSFQLRTYAPTGNGNLGLGTSHPSLEPALLGYSRITDRLRTEGELRLFVPITQTPGVPGAVSGGSSDFASTVFRFGLGLGYDAYQSGRFVISPVAELVGWVFLNGQKTVNPFGNAGADVSAAGDTVVNLKLGTRFKVRDFGDLYVGYGRCLTTQSMYRDIFRAEFRLYF
ncbi:hypothetical protein [Frigoriglobus tundricola]|uniref:Uncharacterized protein n=1 Tax=Frigoriglobus tundricola TaxID=2774151 RepID=A0A6M5Z427_9BACT|nr:hypothetical protein [Frigoriglobus tundricola]QJX00846.1 hypothetical protein FTUN_8484 [Frigoriglobus tundricola]